ncbi:unnamed protein product [Closterium sp. NIES-53]
MYITLYYLVTRLPDSLSSVRDHFLSLCPTELTVDLLEERLAAAEKSILALRPSTGRCFLLVVDNYSRYTSVFPLCSKGDVTEVLIELDLRGGEFSSDLLRAFCRAEGIRETFTLPASPQQNGIAEHRIGMVMDVTRTSMIHAATSIFLWPFVVQYAAHQINLQPRVSLPETTPTLRWTGKVGDASAFRVWGSQDFVRDTSRAIPCVFLGSPLCRSLSSLSAILQFYHPTSRRVLSSQDVTFDESVSYYRVSQVDPAEPVEVAVDSGAARGAEPAGARTGGAEPERVEPRGARPERVEPVAAVSGGAESGGSPGVPLRQEPLSPQRLSEWYARRCRRTTGTAGAGAAGGAAGAGATGGAAGAGAARGAAGAGAARGAAGAGAAGGAAGAGAPRGPAGAGAIGTGGPAGVAAGGDAGAVPGDSGAEGAGAVSAVSGGAARPRPYYVPLLQQVLGLPPSPGPTPPLLSPQPVQSQSQLQPSTPLLVASCVACVSFASLVRTARAGRVLRPRPPLVPGTHSMSLRPSTAPQRVPLPSPPSSSLPDGPDSESDSLRAASPTVTRFLATAVTDPLFESTAVSTLDTELVDFAAACHLDYATSLVAESASASVCPPSVGDAPDIPTPRSYAEAIEGPYSSQWQAPMDAEMASWKSTSTYVDEVPRFGANIVSGMWIFRVKRPPGSPPVFKACYVARGFCQRQGVDFFQTFSPTPKMTTLWVLLHVAAQRDYELHSLDFSTAFLQGSLHEEIWLRRTPGFIGSFPAGTQWSLRRPVYGLR